MSLNKHALKQVGEFWLYMLGILAYAGGVAALTIQVSPYFLFLLMIPLVLGISFVVYSQSEVFDKKPKKRTNELRSRSRR